jgi:hypothetical protein
MLHVGCGSGEMEHRDAAMMLTCGDDYRYIVMPCSPV